MSAAKAEERPKGAEARERGQKADKVRGGTPLASTSSVTLHPISQFTLMDCDIFNARKRGALKMCCKSIMLIRGIFFTE